MAEPQPSSAKAGSAAADAEENPTLKAGSKDDAKAAAALSSLDARGDDADGSKPADSAALTGAMKDLKVDGSSEAKTKAAPKKVKIDAKDVTLIVEHCEINKVKATELLRANDGNLLEALSAYVDGKA